MVAQTKFRDTQVDKNKYIFFFQTKGDKVIDVWQEKDGNLVMVIEPEMKNKFRETSQRIEIPKECVNDFLDRLNKYRIE